MKHENAEFVYINKCTLPKILINGKYVIRTKKDWDRNDYSRRFESCFCSPHQI